MVNIMSEQITVGIPRSLLFYYYKTLWINYLKALNINYIISPKSNKKILEDGITLTNSEACLALKLHMGHVNSIKDKCDYVLVPRIGKLKKNEVVCTNFNALYDITRNTFNTKILNYNLDIKKNNSECKELIKLGRKLGKNSFTCMKALLKAKKKVKEEQQKKLKQEQILFKTKNKKIILVGHPYNVYDSLISEEIKTILKKENITTIINPEIKNKNSYKKIMPTLYFSFHKKIVSIIVNYNKKVDGIIYLSSFPCGTDSLIFDMIKRKIKNKPIINIILDESTKEAGLITRIESFIDIIKEKKNA